MEALELEIKRKREYLNKISVPSKKIRYVRVKDLEAIEWNEKNGHTNCAETTNKDVVVVGLRTESFNETSNEENCTENNVSELILQDDNEANAFYDNISESEILRRLRVRNQPVRLFGETERERILRLREIEATGESTVGQHNDFRAALAVAEKQLLEENLKGRSLDSSCEKSEKKTDDAVDFKGKDYEHLDITIISPELLQSDPTKTCLLIGAYFKRILREWDAYLDAQPEEVRRTVQGRQQKAIQSQSFEYMKPFFKMLKKRRVAPDVLARITEICMYMQQRKYLKSNDAYLRLSIGNAPWPIGVTMVGIHERSAREKIFSSQVAHVLNDETQRKWIQSIKRLMTFVQKKYPPEDMTMMVG